MALALYECSSTSRLSVSNSDAFGGPYVGILTTRKTDIVGKQWVTAGLLNKVVPPHGDWCLPKDPSRPMLLTILSFV